MWYCTYRTTSIHHMLNAFICISRDTLRRGHTENTFGIVLVIYHIYTPSSSSPTNVLSVDGILDVKQIFISVFAVKNCWKSQMWWVFLGCYESTLVVALGCGRCLVRSQGYIGNGNGISNDNDSGTGCGCG